MFGQKQVPRTQTEFVPTAGEAALAAFEAVGAPVDAEISIFEVHHLVTP